MKSIRRRGTLAGLLALIALLSPAVSRAQQELVLWHAYRGEEKTALEAVVAQYNAASATGRAQSGIRAGRLGTAGTRRAGLVAGAQVA